VAIVSQQHIKATNTRYYPCLNGLRAIAALAVLFTHVERIRQPLGMPGLIDLPFNEFLGGLAVTFFFVLSGFLITTLLLKEKAATGTIRLRRFFTNRALRIWPLYYLVLAVGYLVSIFLLKDTSQNPLSNGLLLNLFLVPNLAFAVGLIPDILIQIWSIGTEEQFYLFWPFLLKHNGPRNLLRLFVGIILFWLVVRGAVHLMGKEYEWLNILLFRTRMDCMAIGGLAALLLMNEDNRLYRLLLLPATGWVAAIGFVLLLGVSHRYHASLYQAYAILSGILILRVIARPVQWLESRVPRYLGKISYGIYLLQQFAIFFVFKTLVDTPYKASTAIGGRTAGIGIYLLAAGLTIGLAALSYTFFESRFLRRKV
jgi:peptidoglycan/LPS O-acetylase OafA/YrhL